MKYNKIFISALLPIALLTSCSKPTTISLETSKVETGDIFETVTATGTVESVTQVDVGTQVTGIISKLYVDYNSEVKQGELIAEIEKVLLDSELKSANANMESARLTYEYNKTNYERDKALHDKQLISDYEFDTTKKEYLVSKTAYEKAQADRVKAAKNLNYAEIYSPIDGVVISRDVEVGQTVVSNMTVANLFTIADLNNMQVVANVDEADIGQVKVGQNVTFTVDAFPDDEFSGTVTQVRLSPTTESNVVTYEVIVAAPNPELKLIPGLTANLTIYVTEERGATVFASKALRFTPHEYEDAPNLPTIEGNVEEVADSVKRVWVVRDNKLVPVVIQTGASNGTNTVVTSGLNVGDVVAIGYTAEAVEEEESTDEGSESSPFAPKPPSSKKK
jgi:HlyD family secretion protein